MEAATDNRRDLHYRATDTKYGTHRHANTTQLYPSYFNKWKL